MSECKNKKKLLLSPSLIGPVGGIEQQCAPSEGLNFQHKIPVPYAKIKPGQH